MGGVVENKAMDIRPDNDGAPAIRVKKKKTQRVTLLSITQSLLQHDK